MLPTLHVNLFGGFRLTSDQQPVVSVTTERAQALLAYLLLHRDVPQFRQRLAFQFWTDLSEAQARANLRKVLHHLRYGLPYADRYLITDAKTIQWNVNAPFTLDVAEFEAALTMAATRTDEKAKRSALGAVVGLYQGDLLAGFEDEWIVPERERLRQKWLMGLEQLAQMLEQQQDYQTAIHYMQQRLEVDTLHEATYCHLMRLHSLNGDRASALRVYHRCMTLLREELGIDPSLNTRELYEQLLQDEKPIARQTHKIENEQKHEQQHELRSELVNVSRFESSSGYFPLIGRQPEWRSIQNWLTSPDQTETPLMLLLGESGIGKTRLLEELQKTAQAEGVIVLGGRGFEAEMICAYGVWIDALRSMGSPQAAPTVLASLIPELAGESTPQPGSKSASKQLTDRSRLFDAVVQYLSQIATQSSVLVIFDDVQWFDEASTALLHYAVRLLYHRSPVRFACAARQGEWEENAALFKLVQALRRERRLVSIELAPLNQAQTCELVQRVAENLDGDRIFADSGGNPLFALEVAHALSQDQIPLVNNLEELIRERLLRLDDTARDLVFWAAPMGRSFDPSIVAQISHFALPKLLTAIETLERQGIIRPTTNFRTSSNNLEHELNYDFVHDIVRQVAYQQLSPPRRRLVHLQIAQTLQQMQAAQGLLAGDIAHHANLGGDHLLAATAALTAAKQSLKLFAYAEAAALAQKGIQYCQMLSDPDRIALQLGLLHAYIMSGVQREQRPSLKAELHQLIAAAEKQYLTEAAGLGLQAVILLDYEHGNFSEVHQQSLHAVELSRATDPLTTARMLAYSGTCLAEIGRDMQRSEAILLEAQSLAARVGAEIIDIDLGLGSVRRYRGDYDEAKALLHRAWQRAAIEQDHWRECTALLYLAMIDLETGRPDTAIPYCQKTAIVAAQMGEGSEIPFARSLEALAHYALREDRSEQGSVNQALENAASDLRQIDAKRMLAYILTYAAEIDLQDQHIDRAILRSQEALAAAKAVNQPSEIILAWIVCIRAYFMAGAAPQAVAWLTELEQQFHLFDVNDRAHTAFANLNTDVRGLQGRSPNAILSQGDG